MCPRYEGKPTVKIGRRRLVSPAALDGPVELLEKEAS
jgi:hypothetical protein